MSSFKKVSFFLVWIICQIHSLLAFIPIHNNNNNNNKKTVIIPTARPFTKRDTTSSQLHLSPNAMTALSIIGHVVGGASGTPFVVQTTRPGGWYRKIDLPSWTPPDKIFGPVWTCLYACMGWSVAKIIKSSSQRNPAVALWSLHYLLNILWAPLFFGMQQFRLGFILNLALVVTLATTIPLFYQINKISAFLLIPYASWLLFATKLNQEICKRNPTDKNGYNNAKFQAQLCRMQQIAQDYSNSW
jgi:tryptophan-rich sensory protein